MSPLRDVKFLGGTFFGLFTPEHGKNFFKRIISTEITLNDKICFLYSTIF